MAAFGGRVNGGSGNGWSRKGDGRTAHEVVEFKRTDKSQITVKAADLEKVCNEALADGRVPVLGFEVGGRSYVILEQDDYVEGRCHGSERGEGGTGSP